MEPVESRKHRVRRQLLATLQHLRDANRALYLSEEHISLCRSFSNECNDIFTNIDAIRAGVEETFKLITAEAQKVLYSMETPSAIPPPIKGGFLSPRHTPFQLMLEREGLLKLRSTIPKTFRPPLPPKIPTIIPFTRIKRKYKSRTRKKEGIVPI